jgi:hypothetical protein
VRDVSDDDAHAPDAGASATKATNDLPSVAT